MAVQLATAAGRRSGLRLRCSVWCLCILGAPPPVSRHAAACSRVGVCLRLWHRLRFQPSVSEF